MSNIEWLEEHLDVYIDNDYIVFDLPGQIELYTHFPFMRELVKKLQSWDFRVQALYLLDSQFITNGSKFFGGCISALSAMVQLEVAHINVLSKMDLAGPEEKRRLEEFMYPDIDILVTELSQESPIRFARLNRAMANVLDQFSLVSFVPLDLSEDESLADLVLMVDTALQYDEEVDQNFEVPEEEDAEGEGENGTED